MATPLSDLGKDIEKIDEAMAGALTRFGKMGTAGQKGWTAFARITSGTLVWRLQARLRSVMNVVEIMTDRQAAYNIELADSFKKMGELKNATKNIEAYGKKFTELQKKYVDNLKTDSQIMEALSGNEIFEGLMYKYEDNIGKVLEKGKEFLQDQTDRAEKAMAMDKAGGFLKYYGKKGMQKGKNLLGALQPEMRRTLHQSLTDPNIGPLTKPGGGMDTIKSIQVGFTNAFRSPKIFTRILGGLRPTAIKKLVSKNLDMVTWTNRRKSFTARRDKLFMKIGSGLKLLPKLVGLSLGALGTFMLYGAAVLIGLLLVIAVIKKAWPLMKKQMAFINKFAGITKAFFWGISRMLEGLMMVLSGLWEGDLIKVLKGFWWYIIPGILAVGYSILAGIASLLVTLATSVVGGIVAGLLHVLGKLPFIGKYIPQFAKGGVSSGGLAIVGEEGPELVSLPRGARVHPNGYGPSGSTVINVNVTGRVGASDSEIRDIANKVAREINLRMNTRGTITMGG